MQYNVMPKHHAFDHMSSLCDIMNPKYLSTYTEESMMRTGTRIYSALANGDYPLRIQGKVLSRYVCALELQWSGIS